MVRKYDRGHNIDMGRKEGGAAVRPFRGSWDPRLVQCGLGRGLLPYQAASFIHPAIWPQQTSAKMGWGWVCPFSGVSWVHIEHNLT